MNSLVHGQQVGGRITIDDAAQFTNAFDYILNDDRVHRAQLPVRFNELVIAIRVIPDKLVRSDQAAETSSKYGSWRAGLPSHQ